MAHWPAMLPIGHQVFGNEQTKAANLKTEHSANIASTEATKMNGLTRGFWDSFDQSLQWLGCVAAGFLLRRHSTKGDGILNAAIGGALLSAAFGGVVGFALGFALSDASRVINAVVGTILGGSLGVCLGIWFGLFVEAVDSMIQDTLRTFNSK